MNASVEARYALPPVDGALVATCRDVGRSARAEFSVSIATATKAYWTGYNERVIFPSDDPLVPWFAAADESNGFVSLEPRSLADYPLILDWMRSA